MTNKKSENRRYPWLGVALGGADRLSSASGKALLDARLIGANGLQVHQATALEATFGGLFLLLRIFLWKLTGKGGDDRPAAEMPARSRRILSLMTFGVIGTDKALLFAALSFIPFSVAGGMYYAVPLLIPVIAGFRSGSRGRAALLTLFAAGAALGVVLLVQRDGPAAGDGYLIGVICALGAGVLRTLYLPVTDRLIQGAGRFHTEKVIAWSTLSVGLVAGGIVMLTGGFTFLSWQVVMWAMLVGLLNNTLTRIIQMPARELAGDSVYAVFLTASPLIATLVGLAFLDTRLMPIQWAGVAVITVAAAAVAQMSFSLRDRSHAPLIELSSATPEAVLKHALDERAAVLETLERLTQEYGDCEKAVALAERKVAEARLAKARADAKKAAGSASKIRAEAGRLAAQAETAEAQQDAAEAAVRTAEEGVRLALLKSPDASST
ncbi:DMT family transporter [Actinomadura luteofluorescens]|uniref:DMT family transporter n=1 Tax=Actinomadura luteofluorescens TaxID=46163 RepID=UPI0030D4ACEB